MKVGPKTRIQKMSPQDAMSEIALEIQNLSAEIKALNAEARESLEKLWTVRHTELFPKLCAWKEAIGASLFSTFKIDSKEMKHVSLLSDADSPYLNETINLNSESSNELDECYGNNSEMFIQLAFGSREMQFDFESKTVFMPFVLIQHVNAIIIAKIPELIPEQYASIVNVSTVSVNQMRRIVLNGAAGFDSKQFTKAS